MVCAPLSIFHASPPKNADFCTHFRGPKTLYSDILFPYRSPSPRPHPDPTQHPEKDPKRTRNRPGTEPNGAKRSQTEPKRSKRSRNGPKSSFSGWDGRGVCRGMGGQGGCKGKRKSLTLYFCSVNAFWGSSAVPQTWYVPPNVSHTKKH